MELRHLRYFVAVAEELNYRKASERLRVAQPALSTQIKDLESDVGVRLLDRDTGGVRVTDAGAAFLDEARRILAQVEQAVATAREAAKGRRGHLIVGYFAPIFMGLMPASLKAFRERFPEVEVTLVEIPVMDQIAALEAGTIHVGFTISGGAPVQSNLKHIEVARSPICVVVGRGHRLARQKRIALADIVNEPFLCFVARKGAPSVHGEIMRQYFTTRGLETKPFRQIDGVESFRATLESGLGVSLIAELGSLSRSDELVLRPIQDGGPDFEVQLHALWRGDRSSQLTTNFVEVMREVAPRQKQRAGQSQPVARRDPRRARGKIS